MQLLPRLQQGGVERGVVELSRELRGRGIDSVVVSEGGRLAEDIIKDGGRHITLPVAGKNIFTAPRRMFLLYETLRQTRPDIVHVRSRAPAWLFYFINKKLRLPTVSTVHGINSVNFYGRIMTRADEIICPSVAVRAHIQRHYQTPLKKISVIARGVDINYFNPPAADIAAIESLRKKYDLRGKRVMLHIGRLTKQKGIAVLIDALKKLEAPRQWAALIVGDGKLRQPLMRQVKASSLSTAVHFVGATKNVREFYCLADVVLSCAIKPESFGRVVAESFAMHTPVIAASHGGVLDIVAGTDFARLVAAGDSTALAAALNQPLPDAKNAREHIIKNFTLKQMTEKTAAVYEKLLINREKV